LQVPVDVLVISATWGQGALTTLCSTLYVREDKGDDNVSGRTVEDNALRGQR